MTQLVECLSSIHKAWGLVSSTKSKWAQPAFVIPHWEVEDQEFKVTLGYIVTWRPVEVTGDPPSTRS